MSEENRKWEVLIVDDEQDLCELIGEQIETDSINVDEAYSGEQAMERLKSKKYDVILTDIKMPGMNGLELLKKMNEELEVVPKAYVMTGFSTYTLTHVKEAGGINLFDKPDGIRDLVKTIHEVCSN